MLLNNNGMRLAFSRSNTRISKDHILPREWGGRELHNIANNIRWCCQTCNNHRAAAGHCLGALACVREVARDTHHPINLVMRQWGMASVVLQIRVPGYFPHEAGLRRIAKLKAEREKADAETEN